MIKKTQMMKALIIKSGNQPNGFYISEQEIKNIHCQKNAGKMLIDRTDYTSSVPCGYLIKTELQENKETNELELWGYFMYTPDEIAFKEEHKCSYEISCTTEGLGKRNVMRKCSLVCCAIE